MTLYENKNYKVVVNKMTTGYEVVNKASNVVELEEVILPKAITTAATWDAAVNNALKEVNNVVSIGQPR